ARGTAPRPRCRGTEPCATRTGYRASAAAATAAATRTSSCGWRYAARTSARSFAPPGRRRTRRSYGAAAAASGHAAAALAFQVDQQQRDRRRGHTGNALGLADAQRTHALQLLLYLGRQAAHRGVVEIRGDRGGLMAALALDLLALAVQVAGVLDPDLHLLGHLGI